jgi:hypothetical protein
VNEFKLKPTALCVVINKLISFEEKGLIRSNKNVQNEITVLFKFVRTASPVDPDNELDSKQFQAHVSLKNSKILKIC